MVYVDNFFYPYGRMKVSHLWSPDLEELNEMADKLNLKRKWLQDSDPRFIYYGISKGKREQAIELGAKPITVAKMLTLRRKQFEKYASEKT